LLGVRCVRGVSSTIPTLAQEDEAVEFRFGWAGLGAATYIYAAGISDMVQQQLPDGSSITAQPRAGGIGNIKLVQSGEISA
jgi:TRAP-type uncharacterized transport system substrate-binding protein